MFPGFRLLTENNNMRKIVLGGEISRVKKGKRGKEEQQYYEKIGGVGIEGQLVVNCGMKGGKS